MSTCNSRLHDAVCDLPAGHDEHRGRGKKWHSTRLVGITREEITQLRDALSLGQKWTCNYICTTRDASGFTVHTPECKRIVDAIELLKVVP